MDATIPQQEIDPGLFAVLDAVSDPEIPVLSIVQMGVVRRARMTGDNAVEVQITPTYSGCPAMDVIADDVRAALERAGFHAVVRLVLAPAWTTDWITPQGRAALEAYGIAPPLEATADKAALLGEAKVVKCPRCGSERTTLVSRFGSTACKALFKCDDCLEPFDYFKCLK
jgi:ring-1,2-phenylacetyl-CoA epoxidase subunit PaaD